MGIESARENIGITVSYWKDLSSIKAWKENAEHNEARKKGKTDWYADFKVRITKAEHDYDFNSSTEMSNK